MPSRSSPRGPFPPRCASHAFVSAATILAAATLSFAVIGCEPPPPKSALGYTADAKRAYDNAMLDFDAHNWAESQTLMREVRRKYSYSKYARLAELRIADADYAQEKFADAIREYRQFIHDHRSDQDDVAYARSRIAESDYREIPDSILMPAAEERDQAAVVDAYKELRGFLHDYPSAKESARVRELLADVTARLVRHELFVARFYLDKDNYEAAVNRIQFALRNYGGVSTDGNDANTAAGRAAGLEPEALVLLGETYLKMHKWSDARHAFLGVVQRYPQSPLIVQAQNYLDYMAQRGV